MTCADVAAYVGRWQPPSVSAEAAAFARDVITTVRPGGQERAKNLLWAAGKLADWAIGLGLDPVPEVVLHPSAAERFTRCAPGLSPVARRTLRTNLRFIGRRVVPQLYPADLPLPRERAKAPYSPAQIAGYLALAGTASTATASTTPAPRHEEQDPLPHSPPAHPAGTLTVSSPLRSATPAECQTLMRRSPRPKRE